NPQPAIFDPLLKFAIGELSTLRVEHHRKSVCGSGEIGKTQWRLIGVAAKTDRRQHREPAGRHESEIQRAHAAMPTFSGTVSSKYSRSTVARCREPEISPRAVV